MRIRLVDRYITREFLASVAIALGLVVLVVNLVDLWERMDTYLDRKATVMEVVRFHTANLPFTLSISIPVALLLGSIFALGRLARRNELVALRTSGVSLQRVLLPVLGISLAGSFASLVFNESVVPRANRWREHVNEVEIHGAPPPVAGKRSDIAYLGAEGRMFQIKEYDLRERVMKRVSILEFEGDRLARRLDAEEARWENGHWVFLRGYQRVFDATGREGAATFERLEIPGLAEEPSDFDKGVEDPRLMGYRDLRRETGRLRANGRDARRYEVEMGSRLALPFANFIVVLLGAPLAAANMQGGAARGFGMGLGVAFFYYGLLRLSQTIGQFAPVSPVLAPWLANVIFLVAGLFMLRHASRG
jgi:lipopolysaccharide export system permease protein